MIMYYVDLYGHLKELPRAYADLVGHFASLTVRHNFDFTEARWKAAFVVTFVQPVVHPSPIVGNACKALYDSQACLPLFSTSH